MAKLTKNFLKKLIIEEVSKLNEKVEHDAIVTLLKASGDLLSSMEKFKEFVDTSSLAKNAVEPHFSNLMKSLEEFFENPKQFISPAKPPQEKATVKKVSIKPTNKLM